MTHIVYKWLFHVCLEGLQLDFGLVIAVCSDNCDPRVRR